MIATSAKNFLIVAGEISGDQHAAPLMAALKTHNPDHVFWGLGGDMMEAEGLEALYHARDLSVTGFIEVIKHLSFFKEVMGSVIHESEIRKPNAAILLDYPGFNIRLGVKLKALGIPVYYYISPQVWAWKKGRVKTMRQFIKRMFVIFPFEEEFYKKQGIPVTFAGHPVVEKDFKLSERSEFFKLHGFDESKPLVALLPGSRRNEMERHTQPLLDTIALLSQEQPDIQFVLAGLSSLSDSYYDPFSQLESVKIVRDNPYPMMAHADVAIVASGTATLETAYLGTPLVVIYKIAPVSYLIGKLLVDIEHIAMPNLIIGDRAVPELIQSEASGQTIATEALKLLTDSPVKRKMLNKLETLKELLGQPGCAKIIAAEIQKDLD
ncbi:MAG: lipid-A-disaccharide synthase [Candidatus Marinimicrobia bacterium]|nr:lipid-A-disaccharide synthase [Candidatus Neomarinimicrobiota bacterium]MBT4359357.1 lipid-A-disaccharide synthase [Candidatus Neomarinimicrobiota bacterium]MBT4714274.1 lipid-A-disaccharide synthase [Candidatus Neomarinimicrobiota bacterium]MBT4946740.1 lipid-A-disaccharide synthase [Candidatus Neomarinimicrobiota bacterium]MBT5269231.1 lipid-A-disaccharide synthase [Candidatus Neomarinimicrobiota bacterium]